MEHAAVFRLIAGLGNPGRQYAGTRHNAGFAVVDELARRCAAEFRFEPKWDAETATCGGRIFMKPQTFMNLSGEAVGNYARYYRLAPEEVLVVIDDVALPFGDLRLRKSGSPGGHNGLESVLMHLGTEAVPRLRVGIGSASGALHSHVLGQFTPEEKTRLEDLYSRAADAVEYANAHGVEAAMNIYNKKTTV
ncbi:aminoacyl-tRNA hydrolase [Spartobacteria bacterium LR76]|nr:aminoacyl-tRNA hydrolase [Spartobacteria bacterium LR76]